MVNVFHNRAFKCSLIRCIKKKKFTSGHDKLLLMDGSRSGSFIVPFIIKTMKHNIINGYRIALTLAVSLVFYSCISSQTTAQPNTTVTAAIDSNNWVFTALQVRPQIGRTGPVNGVYTVTYT